MEPRLYLFTIDMNMGEQRGIDLPGTAKKVQALLGGYSSSSKCVHKFKVTGEAKIVAVFAVSNIIGLERMVAGLAKLGNIDVTCKSLKPYEKFAEMLKVDGELTKPSTNSISKDKCLHWLDITINYPGKSTDELLKIWTKEATAALEARVKGGVHLELFKVVGERKVHLFIVMEPDELDGLTWNLPIVTENGSGVTTITKAVQCLDDYASRVSTEKL
ncbi:uncharacterized protein LOC123545492 isoform X2 [Mercenaria mercenaria]|nr:uncharacterized protein LOC123545492 isoform X2 [Mercenaria mercenaria]